MMMKQSIAAHRLVTHKNEINVRLTEALAFETLDRRGKRNESHNFGHRTRTFIEFYGHLIRCCEIRLLFWPRTANQQQQQQPRRTRRRKKSLFKNKNQLCMCVWCVCVCVDRCFAVRIVFWISWLLLSSSSRKLHKRLSESVKKKKEKVKVFLLLNTLCCLCDGI